MRKKNNKIYEVNKWNKLMFMPKNENIFWDGSQMNNDSHAVDFGNSYTNPGNTSRTMRDNFYLKGLDYQTFDSPLDRGLNIGVGNLADASAKTINQEENRTVMDPALARKDLAPAPTAPIIQEDSKPTIWGNVLSSVKPIVESYTKDQLAKGLTKNAASAATNTAASSLISSASAAIQQATNAAAQSASQAGLTGTVLELVKQRAAQEAVNKVAAEAGSTVAKTGANAASKFSTALGAGKLGTLGSMGVGLAGQAVGTAADYLISSGFHTGAGDAIGTAGSMIGTGISFFNPVIGAIVTAATQGIKGIVNRGFGMKTDSQALANVKNAAAQNNALAIGARSYDDIQSPISASTDVYEGGWWRQGDEAVKEAKLREELKYSQRNVENALENIGKNRMAELFRHSHAFGGPMNKVNDSNMSAIDYDFMSRLLAAKERKAEQKDTLTNMFAGTPASMFGEGGDIHIKPSHRGRLTELKERTGKSEAELYNDGNPAHKKMVVFARNARKWKHGDGGQINLLYQDDTPLFAFGGDMQTNSADFPTGLTHIDAGGTHSENPNDGVQMGVDNEGTPNLVEEGETVYVDDSYVFSNRILADEATKKLFRLPKKKDITFADISKRLEKEIAERPNDPISEAGFKAQMQTLEEQQERQKAEMEAARAREAFEALSPEEQTAVMQQVAQQDAMAQEAVQQQAMAEQQAMQQSTPEQAAMMQADGSQTMIGQQPQFAEGGHLYSKGGEILNALGFKTLSEFKKWAKENKAFGDGYYDWDSFDSADKIPFDDLLNIDDFKNAIAKKNPALAHALSQDNPYDFGTYKPDNKGNVTFKDISKGNWLAQDYEGWKDSQDPAWLEAVEKGLVKKGMKQEDIAKALKQTDSYKKGSKWLQDSEDNRLRYLRTILEDENSPEVAKNYAKKFIDENGWRQDAARDYASIFGTEGKGVRETHPGTYWHTPIEAVRGAQAKNWVINDDGSVEEIIGDVPTDWTGAGNYAWATPENDIAYNYYKRPETVAEKVAEEVVKKAADEETDGSQLEAVRKPTWMRYAGLLGPAAGLGLMAAGVGKPDSSDIDAAIASANGPISTADYQPIGNYLTYNPMDIWYQQNALNAQARATDRSLLNSGANQGSKMAGLIANGYNSQLASGNLFRQALEYNDTLKKQVEDFNRGTDMFNAEAYNRTSQFNADARNRGRQAAAQIALQGAAQKMNADAGWYNSLYGNVGGLFKGISDLGRENRETNWRNALVTSGAFGAMDEDALVRAGIAKKRRKASGGNIKRKKGKRGLTY